LGFAQFIIALDFNIVYVALPEIAQVGFSAQSLQWVVSAYAVGFGGFLLLGGRAADRLGARRMFVAGLLLYSVSSLAGGLATEPWALVTARAVQGLGGALLTPATLALINTGFAEGRPRNRALAVWEAPDGPGGKLAAANGIELADFLPQVPTMVGMTTGTLIEADEVAAHIAFLASEHARSILGPDHLIDGGVIKTT
jgi:MFS family permease